MPFYFQCNKIPRTLLGAAALAELWRRKALQLLLLLLLILNVDDGGLFAAAHELLPYRGLNGSGLIHPLSSTHSLLVLSSSSVFAKLVAHSNLVAFPI